MAKNKLYISNADDKRSFLEKLTVAYAPIDELVMHRAREIAKEEVQKADPEADTSDRKHGLGVRFAVRHLGSI